MVRISADCDTPSFGTEFRETAPLLDDQEGHVSALHLWPQVLSPYELPDLIARSERCVPTVGRDPTETADSSRPAEVELREPAKEHRRRLKPTACTHAVTQDLVTSMCGLGSGHTVGLGSQNMCLTFAIAIK
jgi:hypothetical protein